jgi:hypothetical protein
MGVSRRRQLKEEAAESYPPTYCVDQNLLCGCVANAIDVLQRELHILLVGNFHTAYTCCLDPEGRPEGRALEHNLQHHISTVRASFYESECSFASLELCRALPCVSGRA